MGAGPYPGDIGTYACPPGSTPEPILDPTGGVVGYQCRYPDGQTRPPIPINVPTLPPGYNPSGPPPPPPTRSPPPAATNPRVGSPITQRQPGAPAVPYNPPGRIGLWPGPIFNQSGTGATTFTSTGSTSVTGSLPGVGAVLVDVSQAVNLADNSASNAVQNVANAVSSAIGQAVDQANSVAAATQADISNALLQNVGAINQGVGTVFTSLLQGLQALNLSVGGALGDIGTTIGSDLVNSLNPVTGALEALIIAITQQIGGLSGQIARAVAVIIPEIVRAISDPIGAVKDVLTSISNEIGNNLASLTQIPGAIATASTTLDATLQRTLASYESFTEKQTGWGQGDTAHSDLSAIWKALAGLTTTIIGGANPKPSDHISAVCGQDELTKLLNEPWFDNTGNSGYWADVWHALLKGVVSTLFYIAELIPAIGKANEELRQRLDQACPIEPLPANAVVDAMQRGFLSYPEGVVEAAKGDLNETRLKILSDLATHQMAPAQLLEAFYRQIIPESDLTSALAAQGWTAGQQAILKALGIALLTVAEAGELYRRGAIDKPTLQSILAAHQYDKSQQDAIASLAFRPPHTQEAIEGGAAADAFNALGGNIDPQVFTPPEYVEKAAAAEGLDHDATVQRWLSHWNTGGLNLWIELFFRGQVTQHSLEAFAARDFVPPAILTALIEAQRPLVQFRTIQTMLRSNLIDDAAARVLLRQHGYSEANITLLIGYAHRPGPAKASHNASALHAASLGIAKEEYIDGSITGDQYLAILTQHGYTVDGANTELQVVNAHQALLRRKEHAQLVIDEYGAGLIDEQGALAQLAVLGLTVDELARAAHKIRAFRGKTAKHPSEADLHHFLQNGIVTEDEYVAELVAQGYSKKWAQDFLAWRQLPSSPASGAAAQSAPTSTGG